ncbi:AAC(3) family N-acetyltransferase [Thalassospiraceae bacterium LMO-SO8]|nr:AAC(3) family N-acetyltransferase [Alphaproteobacteria bacterium LMO-S08]WND77650.1 AAC(3) family N-acetyltransferase [Thalassospiraceae bacterium LMO-SO8]
MTNAEIAIFGLFEALSIPRSGATLIHTAFKRIADGSGLEAAAVVRAFCDYKASGTLLMPTMSWRLVRAGIDVFDVRETPSNVGILTDIFRTQHAQKRSLHPTHSVAGRGDDVAEILSRHHEDETPVSAKSPFGMLPNLNATVVLFGVGMECCTLMHHVEETIAPDCYLQPSSLRESFSCKDEHGAPQIVHVRRHLKIPRRYQVVSAALDERGLLARHVLGGVEITAFRACDALDLGSEMLRRQPDFFLQKFFT